MSRFALARPLVLPAITGGLAVAGDIAADVGGGLPAWLASANPDVNEVVAIPDTGGAGGATLNPFCGWAFDPVRNLIWVAAAGGHGDSYDNRVVMLDLNADSTGWALRKASTGSPSTPADQTHEPDGTPKSRHVYPYVRWSEFWRRVILYGCYSPYGGVYTLDAVDAFDPDTNQWDTAGTFASITPGFYANAHEGTGNSWAMWGTSGTRKWTESTGTWSNPTVTGSTDLVRFPWAWDSTRSHLVGLCWADGQGSGTGVHCLTMDGSTKVDITFNSSAARTQFIADAPEYAGMDYDSANDCFLFYEGRSAKAGRFFKVTPNGTTTWDMSVLSVTGTSVPATINAGIHSRFSFVSFGSVAGFVFMPSAADGCYFLRTR